MNLGKAPNRHPLAKGHPPDWASGWGQDRYGVFVTLTVGDATQRMRWIPPGTFRMGSPEDEPGRWADEGPRHTVTLTHGFWLFDTPCTQQLWDTVMWHNRSRFRSPDRPVETTSWDDAQDFLERLNGRIPGLSLTLPTEAQWEYACRAGTEMALYSGAIAIEGENNAPALDAIAWYGGNSGGGGATWTMAMTAPVGRRSNIPTHGWGRIRWAASRPTPGGYTTRWAMSGNGARTAGGTTRLTRSPTRAGRKLPVLGAFVAVVPGSTTHGSFAPRSAAGATRPAASARPGCCA